MKNTIKFLSTCLMIILSFNSFAQQKFSKYTSAFVEESYDLELSSKNGEFKLWINAFPVEKRAQEGGIKINEDQYPNFIKAIAAAKIKYKEWVVTAKQNNVTELFKDINVKSQGDGFFMYGDHWNFDYDINLKFSFQVIVNSKGTVSHCLVIRTGKLTSSENRYIDSDGFMVIFDSVDAIDEFTEKISRQKIDAFISKPKTEELFKD